MKDFIIIGNGNAVTYKEIFPLIKENKMWVGAGKGMGGKAMEFVVDASIYDTNKGSVNRIENGKCYVGVMMCTWFTNVEHTKRNTPLDLYKKYNAEEYPKYDNYDAIEVSRVENIPMDYDGIMGVPISFLDKYCPEQFEILGMCENLDLYGLKTKVYTTEECRKAYFDKFGKKGTYDLNASGVIIQDAHYEKVYQRILIRKIL